MLLDFVAGREAHQEAVVPGDRVRKALDRQFKFPVLALVFVKRDFLRKSHNWQNVGQQRLLPALDDDVGPDRSRAPTIELRGEIGDHARDARLLQRINEIDELGTPTLRKVDGVELVDLNRQISERDIVDPQWDDELVVLQRFLHRISDRNLVAHAAPAAFAARSGNYRDDLGSLLPDRVFYADPEWRPAGEIEDGNPDLVTVAG